MEVSVKRIYTRNDQNEIALVFEGRKWANCVVVDYPVRVWTMPLRDAAKLEAPKFRGDPYPVKRLAESLMSLGKKNGITVAAERLCQAALDGTELSSDAIDVKPSENGADVPQGEKTRTTAKVKANMAEDSEDMLADTKSTTKAAHKQLDRAARSKPTKKKAKRATDPLGIEAGVKAIAKSGTPRGNVVAEVSKKYGLDPKDARKALRKAGLSAPYDDASKVDAVLAKVKAK